MNTAIIFFNEDTAKAVATAGRRCLDEVHRKLKENGFSGHVYRVGQLLRPA